MDYPHLKKRFTVAKVLFVLVLIGFICLVYAHSILHFPTDDLLLRIFGLFLVAESTAKFIIFPYKGNEKPLQFGRAIRVIIGLYLLFHF